MAEQFAALSELLHAEPRPSAVRRDIDLVARLSEAAPAADWAALWNWRQASPAVQERLARAFPAGPGELADLLTDGRGGFLRMWMWRNDPDCLKVKAEPGGPIKHLNRIFAFRRDAAFLNDFIIDKRERRAGLGMRVLLGTHEAVRRLDLSEMVLTASKAGAYVWAKAGFAPQDEAEWERVNYQIQRRLHNGRPKILLKTPAAVVDEITGILREDSPKAIWRIADLPYEIGGRKIAWLLLVRNSWEGVFRMGDGEAEARLREYARSRGA